MVSNIFYFSIYWEFIPTDFHIFQGVGLNHQPASSWNSSYPSIPTSMNHELYHHIGFLLHFRRTIDTVLHHPGHLCVVSEDVLQQAPTLHAILEHLAEVGWSWTLCYAKSSHAKSVKHQTGHGPVMGHGFAMSNYQRVSVARWQRVLLVLNAGIEEMIHFITINFIIPATPSNPSSNPT